MKLDIAFACSWLSKGVIKRGQGFRMCIYCLVGKGLIIMFTRFTYLIRITRYTRRSFNQIDLEKITFVLDQDSDLS